VTPTKELGVWTYDECALVLVDFQKEMFETIHSETSAGAVPSTALAVLTEMFRDWRSPLAAKSLEVIDWYFAEVPEISKDIGVDHREKVPA
jgi:hypothetical protein